MVRQRGALGPSVYGESAWQLENKRSGTGREAEDGGKGRTLAYYFLVRTHVTEGQSAMLVGKTVRKAGVPRDRRPQGGGLLRGLWPACGLQEV